MSPITVRQVSAADIGDIADIYAFDSVLANTAQIPHRSPQFWADFYKTRDPNGVELAAVAKTGWSAIWA